MDPELDRALEELELAASEASSVVQTQLHSIDEGVFEEDEGASTQEDPGPKVDRLAELSAKLQGLEDEANDDGVRRHITAAREHVQAYLKQHPQGGYRRN